MTGETPDSDTPATPATPDIPAQHPKPRNGRDRARRRAIRAHAAQAGVAYSIAARQLAAAGLGPGEYLGSSGRTVYPVSVGGVRWTIATREARPAAEKLASARLGGRLPGGRARHLFERFPAGEGLGAIWYAGEGRQDLLAMVYLVAAHDAPGLVPAPLDLSWTAELGEETAVDTVCADLDRAARHVLDDGVAERWQRIETALFAAQRDGEWTVRYEADLLTMAYRGFVTPGEDRTGEPFVVRAPWEGVRQVLDALLVIADDGHAPGTRMRLAVDSAANGANVTNGANTANGSNTATGVRREGTVHGVSWGAAGPPVGYEVRLDGETANRSLRPEEIVILPDQEADAELLTVEG